MQNLKTNTKILLIVLSIVAISAALGLFVAYQTDMVKDTIKASILNESVEKAQNQSHLIMTPSTDIFNKEGEEEKAPEKQQPKYKEAPNYLAKP